MMKKWRFLLILMICIGCLAGCTRLRIIDKLSIVHVLGLDIDDDNQLIGTALYPDYKKSKTVEEIKILRENALTGDMFYQKMNKHTSTPVKLAKIRVLVIGNEFAKGGIGDEMKELHLNAELGTNLQIAISEKSAEETLRVFSKGDSLTLIDTIVHNMTVQNLPETNLHIFFNHFFGKGMDAFVPMVKTDPEENVMVNGIGILKGDKLKLQLNEEQTFLFAILKDDHNQGTLKMEVEHEGEKGVIITRGHKNEKKWRIKRNKQQETEVDLSLKLEWTVTKYPDWIDLTKSEDKDLLKRLITAEVSKKIESLLDTFKENEVDPVGIGNIVRSRQKDWDETNFYDKYPNLPIKVQVNLEIINTGLKD